MKVLFDQGTPAPLRNHLPGHTVATAYELGWDALENGALLQAVEAAAKRLHELRRRRNAADYDLRRPVPTGSLSKTVADADGVIHVLDALTPAERAQITDAMKLYEQGSGDVTWRP